MRWRLERRYQVPTQKRDEVVPELVCEGRHERRIRMQYLLLIYNDERAWAEIPDEERAPIIREYFALTDEMRAAGAHVAGAPLQPTSTSQTVRVRGGESIVTDGPFAETKEQLGGFYLVEADSADEALAWAEKIPAARYGSIEVRPLLPVPAAAPAA
jgi:hypothetical protein